MNITVLGATGRTGTPLVEELLRRGHTITALVRDPARLGPAADRIHVVVGDSTDPAALGRIDVPGDTKGTRDKIISALIQRLGGAVVADKPQIQGLVQATDDQRIPPQVPACLSRGSRR